MLLAGKLVRHVSAVRCNVVNFIKGWLGGAIAAAGLLKLDRPLALQQWAKEYGPVYKFFQASQPEYCPAAPRGLTVEYL